jgi:ketosteroid isomerase-like protein
MHPSGTARGRLVVPVLLVLAVLLSPSPLHADERAELTALLHTFLAGASRDDLATHERFWADDLIYTTSSGKRIGKADIRRDVKASPAPKPGDPVTTYTAEEIRVQPYGDMAVLAFRLVATTKKDGETEIQRYLNTGTFARRAGQWRAVAWQATRTPMVEGSATLTAPRKEQEKAKTMRATGTFEVTLNPLPTHDKAEAAKIGRMSIDKRLQGDLAGTSTGEMLTAMTDVKGSAGYVAIEKFTGTLHGKSGSFVLQHDATMTRGEGHLAIAVVPDSGTGDLTGISGTLSIEIAGGKHSYVFEYALPVR